MTDDVVIGSRAHRISVKRSQNVKCTMIRLLVTVAIIAGAYSHALREDPEVKYTAVSRVVEHSQLGNFNVTFLAPTDYQQGLPS